jgi:AraC-like DNA-binding protein
MHFRREPPSAALSRFVECYWMISDRDKPPRQQKIIPDGYAEIIVHLGDPYRINIQGEWADQSQFLLAGQLKKYFYLENTGESLVFGIKFKPAAITLLFDIAMSSLTDRVEDFCTFNILGADRWKDAVLAVRDFDQLINASEQFLHERILICDVDLHPVERSLAHIFSNHGASSVEALAESAGVGKRQLEIYFKKYVGLSPKFFSRLIRFSRIFQLTHDAKPNWTEVAYLAGYFDQAHFIKNFKAFTGEEPGRYGFDKVDFANFFMMKKN